MSDWISVKDRLPEVGVEVVTLVKYANSLNAHNDYLIETDSGVEWDRSAWECVLYWFPFPNVEKA